MSNSGSIRQLWLKWKMLRLPWRKKFLIGEDLSGNTYWEFKDALSHNRWRRIVQARNRRIHHADVKVSPQWHQWLRQTRADPPTIQEQQMDITRQVQLAHNAKLADARWAAKAKYIEKPQNTVNPEAKKRTDAVTAETGGAKQGIVGAAEQQQQQRTTPDPWEAEKQRQKATASNPGGTWQPEAWTPGAKQR